MAAALNAATGGVSTPQPIGRPAGADYSEGAIAARIRLLAFTTAPNRHSFRVASWALRCPIRIFGFHAEDKGVPQKTKAPTPRQGQRLLDRNQAGLGAEVVAIVL